MVLFKKKHPPIGARPGTLVIAQGSQKPVIRVFDYAEDHCTEHAVASPEDLKPYIESGSVSWIDVQGMGDEDLLRRIGDVFALHPLALEDAVNVPQRPKAEDYDHQTLFVTRMAQLRRDERDGDLLDVEQVSIFVGPHYVLSLQERRGDVFDPVRARIRAGKGPIRRSGPDYLAYALIDTVIDSYYPLLEAFGDRLEELEDQIFRHPTRETFRDVYHVRREILALRRAVWPHREAVSALIRGETPLVTETVRVYLRDCHDHVLQIADVAESYRELAGSLVDTYLSLESTRTNEVMKVLTVTASIFIPLTFLAGIYGMNFEHMPELHERWSYPVLLAVMAALAIGMLLFFRRRGWLGGDQGPVD